SSDLGVDADPVAAETAHRLAPAVEAAGVPGAREAHEGALGTGVAGAPAAREVVLARPVAHRHAALQGELAEPVAVEGAVRDHRPQPELVAELPDRLHHALVDLGVHADRVLVTEQPAQVLEIGPELGLLTLAALPRLPGLVVALAAQQRAAQPLVH